MIRSAGGRKPRSPSYVISESASSCDPPDRRVRHTRTGLSSTARQTPDIAGRDRLRAIAPRASRPRRQGRTTRPARRVRIIPASQPRQGHSASNSRPAFPDTANEHRRRPDLPSPRSRKTAQSSKGLRRPCLSHSTRIARRASSSLIFSGLTSSFAVSPTLRGSHCPDVVAHSRCTRQAGPRTSAISIWSGSITKISSKLSMTIAPCEQWQALDRPIRRDEPLTQGRPGIAIESVVRPVARSRQRQERVQASAI